MTPLLALGVLALAFMAIIVLFLWLLAIEEHDRPLLDLFEAVDFDAPVPDGMPAYTDPRGKAAA